MMKAANFLYEGDAYKKKFPFQKIIWHMIKREKETYGITTKIELLDELIPGEDYSRKELDVMMMHSAAVPILKEA